MTKTQRVVSSLSSVIAMVGAVLVGCFITLAPTSANATEFSCVRISQPGPDEVTVGERFDFRVSLTMHVDTNPNMSWYPDVRPSWGGTYTQPGGSLQTGLRNYDASISLPAPPSPGSYTIQWRCIVDFGNGDVSDSGWSASDVHAVSNNSGGGNSGGDPEDCDPDYDIDYVSYRITSGQPRAGEQFCFELRIENSGNGLCEIDTIDLDRDSGPTISWGNDEETSDVDLSPDERAWVGDPFCVTANSSGNLWIEIDIESDTDGDWYDDVDSFKIAIEAGVDPCANMSCQNGCQNGRCNTCSPNSTEGQSCTTGGCSGTWYRTCQSNGEWGSWSGCQKNNACCGVSCTHGCQNGRCNPCSPGNTDSSPCFIGGCSGTMYHTCQSNGEWDSWSSCYTGDPCCGMSCARGCQNGRCNTCSPNSNGFRSCITTDGCAGNMSRPCQSNGEWGSWSGCQKSDVCCGVSCPDYCLGDFLYSDRQCSDGSCTNGSITPCNMLPPVCTEDNSGGVYSGGFCSTEELACRHANFTPCDGNCENGQCACQSECTPIPEYTCKNNNSVSEQCVLGANGCYAKQGTTCLYGCNALTGRCIPYNSCASKRCYDGDVWCFDSAQSPHHEDTDCRTSSCESWSVKRCNTDNTKVIRTRTCHDRGCSSNACFDQTRTETRNVETCTYGCNTSGTDHCNACSPNDTDSSSCTVDGCSGTKTCTCQSNGEWGSWSGCQKSDVCCGVSCPPDQCDGNVLRTGRRCSNGSCTNGTAADCSALSPVCTNDNGGGVYSNGFCSTQDLKCYHANFTPCDGNCENGRCACQNECSSNEKGCYGFGYRICELGNNGCYNWSEVKLCEEQHTCVFGECVYNPPPCEFVSGRWGTDQVKDGDEVELIINTTTTCEGATDLEIWEKDLWILPDDFQIGYGWPLTPPSTTAYWVAVYEKEMTDLFDFCEGPDCIHTPEYYFKAYHAGAEVLNTANQELLKVTPFYGSLTLQEYLDGVLTRVREQQEQNEWLAYNECLNSVGTITDHCRELLERANVTPHSVEITDTWRSISDWWHGGLEFFDPGYLLIVAAGCASCEVQQNMGQLFVQPANLGELFDGAVNEEDFSYPFGLDGPKACEICMSGLLEALDNPQILVGTLAWSLSKVILTAGIKRFAQREGIEAFEYVIDDTGRGARMTYTIEDDVFEREMIFLEGETGNLLLHQAVYKNAIRLFAGGKEFILFNAAEGGVIAEISSLSRAGKQFVAEGLFETARFPASYHGIKALAPEISRTRIVFNELDEAVPFGRYDPISNIKEVNINFPEDYYGTAFTKADIVIMVAEHEDGHVLQAIGTVRKGYQIKPLAALRDQLATTNHVLEYFNEVLMLERSPNPTVYRDLLRLKISRFRDQTPIDSLVRNYRTAVWQDSLQQHLLTKFYNLADDVGMPEIRTWIREGFENRFPEGWDTFERRANRLVQDARVYNAEVLTSTATPSDEFARIIDNYFLDYWGTTRNMRMEEGENNVAIIDDFGDSDPLQWDSPSPEETVEEPVAEVMPEETTDTPDNPPANTVPTCYIFYGACEQPTQEEINAAQDVLFRKPTVECRPVEDEACSDAVTIAWPTDWSMESLATVGLDGAGTYTRTQEDCENAKTIWRSICVRELPVFPDELGEASGCSCTGSHQKTGDASTLLFFTGVIVLWLKKRRMTQ